jgi:hypothetical protein
MSTKSTVAYGPNFHFYQEVLDENFIYLRLEGVQFEASYNEVTVPIPVHIWEVIRQYPGADLSWADKTDEEVAQYVVQRVDERIKQYQQAETDRQRGFISLCGSLVFGGADSSRQEQIDNGMSYYLKTRDHQKQIQQAIEDLRNQQR